MLHDFQTILEMAASDERAGEFVSGMIRRSADNCPITYSSGSANVWPKPAAWNCEPTPSGISLRSIRPQSPGG